VEQWAKSTLTERDHRTLRRIVSKNHTITAAQVTEELNIHLKDPVSTKTVHCELHISKINGRAATAKPLIIESNAQMCSGTEGCVFSFTYKIAQQSPGHGKCL
jgi:hypothetical protein